MIREPRRSVWPTNIVAGLVLLVFLPVLYLAGAGPAAHLAVNGRMSFRTFVAMYGPLWDAADYAGVGGALDWYVDLWSGQPVP